MQAKPLIARLQFPFAAMLLVACLLLGGGQGGLGDTACQLLALTLMAASLWRHASDPAARLPGVAWLAAVPLALPLFQLLPMPEALWLAAPARVQIAAELGAAGLEPATRASLVPLATERALLWLLPAVALFLSVLQFDLVQRRRLLQLLLALAVLAVVLGIAQLAGGPDSALRLYTITNPSEAVGFFANRNHYAGLLAMALPLVLIGGAASLDQHAGDGTQPLRLLAGIGLAALLILGIALARSRAGLFLGMLAIVLSVPAVLALRRQRGTRRILVLAVTVGLVLSVQFALFGILQRFEADPLEDGRFRYVAVATQVAAQQAPWGTGLGGFRAAFEAADLAAADTAYVNHAHNDYAELWLEGGLPAAVLALPLALAFGFAGWRAWRRRDEEARGRLAQALQRASWIMLLLVLLHAIVDYPLRTSAHLAVFGLLAACLSRTPPRAEA